MAPSANIDTVAAERSGKALDHVSDLIDEVNIIKGKQQKQQQPETQSQAVQEPAKEAKDKTQFRQYEDACDRVKSFYREQHTKQTVAYNLRARNLFHFTARDSMSVWAALEKLDSLVDESDPDTQVSQLVHALQTAEAIRRDGKPRWMQCAGLIHDLGKLLYFYGASGQWDVVGDTFPVGCKFDETRIVYPGSFSRNPDSEDPIYSTELGIYAPRCGLDNVMLSWGHDEYLYHVVKSQSRLPDEALAMIRYHSFYPWHREGGYRQFMNEKDEEMLEVVKDFNQYDLYSKADDMPGVDDLKPYYMDLIDEFFPEKVINW